MTDPVPYSTRLEEKIDQLQNQMIKMNEVLIRLTVINDGHKIQSDRSATDIDAIKTSINFARGAVFICMLLIAAVGACVAWAFNSISYNAQKVNDLSALVGINSLKVTRVDTDNGLVEQRVTSLERKDSNK
jgi:hypothetical protein